MLEPTDIALPFSARRPRRLAVAHKSRDPRAYAKKFSGQYAHRTIKGGIGHNLPQEAPHAFAEAVVDVDGHAT